MKNIKATLDGFKKWSSVGSGLLPSIISIFGCVGGTWGLKSLWFEYEKGKILAEVKVIDYLCRLNDRDSN